MTTQRIFEQHSHWAPLTTAIADRTAAVAAYQNYRDRQDQLASQLTAIRNQYDTRLFQIVGHTSAIQTTTTRPATPAARSRSRI